MKKLAWLAVAATLAASSAAQAQAPAPAPASGAPPQAAVPATSTKVIKVPGDATLSYNLIGLNVYDGANASVGEIKDLVLERNQVIGYILSVGGFLGMGEHYVAVSPGSLGIAYNDNDKKWRATINLTKDELKNAPQFKYEGKFSR